MLGDSESTWLPDTGEPFDVGQETPLGTDPATPHPEPEVQIGAYSEISTSELGAYAQQGRSQ
jgi:hypothetical protein